jgi:hypothetical protein
MALVTLSVKKKFQAAEVEQDGILRGGFEAPLSRYYAKLNGPHLDAPQPRLAAAVHRVYYD